MSRYKGSVSNFKLTQKLRSKVAKLQADTSEALALLKEAANIIDSEYPESDERFQTALKIFALLKRLEE